MKKRISVDIGYLSIFVLFCVFLFSCNNTNNTPPPPYKHTNVGVTKFIVTGVYNVDDFFSKYTLDIPGNGVIYSKNVTISDSIGKYNVGDVLILTLPKISIDTIRVSNIDSTNKK